MNEHTEAPDWLTALAAGELEGEERLVLEAHLVECDECRSWLETYRSIAGAFAEAGKRVAVRQHASSESLARLAADADSLEPSERQAIRRHLSECDTCQGEYELVLVALARARPEPEELAHRVRPFPWRRSVSWVARAAALAAVLASVWWFSSGRLTSPPRDLQVAGELLEGRRLLEATRSVSAREARVQSGSAVTMRAGESVSFGEGFTVDSDADLVVEVTSKPASGV